MAMRYDPATLVGGVAKDMRVIANVNANGYAGDGGRPFSCVANAAGALAFKTHAGTDIVLNLQAGDEVKVGSVPVLIQSIAAAGTTVTSVTVAYYWF